MRCTGLLIATLALLVLATFAWPCQHNRQPAQSEHSSKVRWAIRQRHWKRRSTRRRSRHRKKNSKKRRRRTKRRPKHKSKSKPPCTIQLPRLAVRIVGGEVAPWASSYNVALFSGKKRCSGALISESWILSAAHCRLSKGDRIVVGGDTDSGGHKRRAKAIHRHPDFTREKGAVLNDAMLVRLDRPVSSETPIVLNSAMNEPRGATVARVTGYGRDKDDVRGALRAVDVLAVPISKCRSRFRRSKLRNLAKGLNDTYHICANHDACDVGVCYGDSGGPLVAQDRSGRLVQIGVTSYGGARCGSRYEPDVYARVALFRHWIERVTDRKAKFINMRPM